MASTDRPPEPSSEPPRPLGEGDPEPSSEPPRSPDEGDPKRYASLHELIDDDPYVKEPFWPPILLGLGLVVVISVIILWRHGVVSF